MTVLSTINENHTTAEPDEHLSEYHEDDIIPAKYLIISCKTHILSPLLYFCMDRVHRVTPHEVNAQLLEAFDMILIVDSGISDLLCLEICQSLEKLEYRLAISICEEEKNRMRWLKKVESTYCPTEEGEQEKFINTMIASMELERMNCFDFADLRCFFYNMGFTTFNNGSDSGANRAVLAMKHSVSEYVPEAETALVMLFSGGDARLDEFEEAMIHLDKYVPENCCTAGIMLIVPPEIARGKMEVSVFISYG